MKKIEENEFVLSVSREKNEYVLSVSHEDYKNIKNGELFESFLGVCNLMGVKQYGVFLLR